MSHLTILYQIW